MATVDNIKLDAKKEPQKPFGGFVGLYGQDIYSLGPNYYCVQITDDSLAPTLQAGEQVICDPDRTDLHACDCVVVHLRHGRRVPLMLCEDLDNYNPRTRTRHFFASETEISFQTFNPRQTHLIPAVDIDAIHLIVAKSR